MLSRSWYLLLLLPLLALSGCGDFLQLFASKPKPVISKSMQVRTYIEQMALTQLALNKQPDDIILAKPHLKRLRGFTAGKGVKSKYLQLAVLTLEYTSDGQSEKQKLIVPITLAEKQPEFSSLKRVTEKLTGIPYTLYNVRAHYVAVPFPPTVSFSKDDATVLRKQLASEQEDIMANAQSLSPVENVRLQLQLVHFFMQKKMRDGAYLALENAKETLAYLAEKWPETDISSFSKEADTLETNLRKTMPYKLWERHGFKGHI